MHGTTSQKPLFTNIWDSNMKNLDTDEISEIPSSHGSGTVKQHVIYSATVGKLVHIRQNTLNVCFYPALFWYETAIKSIIYFKTPQYCTRTLIWRHWQDSSNSSENVICLKHHKKLHFTAKKSMSLQPMRNQHAPGSRTSELWPESSVIKLKNV